MNELSGDGDDNGLLYNCPEVPFGLFGFVFSPLRCADHGRTALKEFNRSTLSCLPGQWMLWTLSPAIQSVFQSAFP